MEKVPLSPVEADWKFVDELKKPIDHRCFDSEGEPGPGQIDLRAGVCVRRNFPDTELRLNTAYDDLDAFFKQNGVPKKDDGFEIITEQRPAEVFESYVIDIDENCCRITAGDTEGIRRGIFELENKFKEARNAFLFRGRSERKPWVKNRISRCFFGPIKRPPKCKDELMDTVNYYPDHYLNKLAHDGVNGLWLTVEFGDLYASPVMGNKAENSIQRLRKLNETVQRCLRYGIKIYIFCIEPKALDIDDPALKLNPDIGGHTGSGKKMVCPFSEKVKRYLEDCTAHIFSKVPELGGMINISYGERATSCLSGGSIKAKRNCPVCSKKEAWEIHFATLEAMRRGMDKTAAHADLISWLYIPQNGTGLENDFEQIYEIGKHLPKNVTLMYNFESGGEKEQLGKKRLAGDYWLSYTGPSGHFETVARNVEVSEGKCAAKLQVCNCHELATVPTIPVPEQLYKKYSAMYKLGVSTVMQCWYFGNMPGLMNRAAGELSFEPFPESADDFLLKLARSDWGLEDAPQVVQAWRLFSQAYENYPLSNPFQYYGPMHDGVVWPLLLKPQDRTLSPTWLLAKPDYTGKLPPYVFPPSGDRIGEAFANTHTLKEVLTLCKEMTRKWNEGTQIFLKLAPKHQDIPDRRTEIIQIEALNIHFRSGYNILKFYSLRERMIFDPDIDKMDLLAKMREIVIQEIHHSKRMIELCKADPFLGFHSEAEGYKYFPDKLRWRIKFLQDALEKDFPQVESMIQAREELFAEYSGRIPHGKIYRCATGWDEAEMEKCLDGDSSIDLEFKAIRDKENIKFRIITSQFKKDTVIMLELEPRRLHVPVKFIYSADNGRQYSSFCADSEKMNKLWKTELLTLPTGGAEITMTIPFAVFEGLNDGNSPMRFNIYQCRQGLGRNHEIVKSYLSDDAPVVRLGLGKYDSQAYGWLLLG